MFSRPARDVEICQLEHSGALPAPWVAPGFVANLVLEGAATLSVRGREHLTVPGKTVLVAPEEVRFITRRLRPRAVTRSFIVESSRFHEAMGERGLAKLSGFSHAVVGHLQLRRSLLRLYELVDSGEQSLAVEGAIEGVLDVLAEHVGSGRRTQTSEGWPESVAVRRARSLIDAHAEEQVTLERLAAESRLSRTQLVRSFRRALGITPHQYLLHVRVARARILLVRGMSVTDAAVAVGFFDQSHFHRCFVRLVGETPGRYREAT